MPDRVYVVRPYSERIRHKMFECLAEAGLHIDQSGIIAPGTSDDEALRTLPRGHDAVLLVPYNAHRSESGATMNGLDFARRIDSERPDLSRAPILMPISAMGMAGASLTLSRSEEEGGLAQSLRRRILFITEEDLNTPLFAKRVRRHVDGELTGEFPIPP